MDFMDFIFLYRKQARDYLPTTQALVLVPALLHVYVCVCVCVYIYIYIYIHTHSFASVMSLCDSMDRSPPGSSVHRIFLARILAENSLPMSHQGTNCSLYVSCVFCGRG